jgi:hypothetical protein
MAKIKRTHGSSRPSEQQLSSAPAPDFSPSTPGSQVAGTAESSNSNMRKGGRVKSDNDADDKVRGYASGGMVQAGGRGAGKSAGSESGADNPGMMKQHQTYARTGKVPGLKGGGKVRGGAC